MKKNKDSNQKVQQSHKRAKLMARRKKAYHVVKLALTREYTQDGK